MVNKTTTSLATTIRHITGLSAHLPEFLGDFLAQAAAWDKMQDPSSVARAANILSKISKNQWSSVSVGVLIDVACDLKGSEFLGLVASQSPPAAANILKNVINQADLILDDTKSFQDIPSISDLMKNLDLPPCHPKSIGAPGALK